MKISKKDSHKESGDISLISISNSFNHSDGEKNISTDSRGQPSEKDKKKVSIPIVTVLILMLVCIILALVLTCLIVNANGFITFVEFLKMLFEKCV